VDFANLFRDALGVEPDKHLDLTNFGWEKLQSALDSAVLSDEAPKLFDQAADRFQEVTAHGKGQNNSELGAIIKRARNVNLLLEERPSSEDTSHAPNRCRRGLNRSCGIVRISPHKAIQARILLNASYTAGLLGCHPCIK
jgi:hypothetical protein